MTTELYLQIKYLAETFYEEFNDIPLKVAYDYAKKIMNFNLKLDELVRECKGTRGLVDRIIKMELKEADNALETVYGRFKRNGMIKVKGRFFVCTVIYCDNWFYKGGDGICREETEFPACEIEDLKVIS